MENTRLPFPIREASVAPSNAAKADFYLVIVTLLAAISWIFSREAVLLMPPLLFMALRFLLAGLLLGAIGYRELSLLNSEACMRAMKIGLVFGAGMSCWVMGLFMGTHVGEGAFLTSLGVVLGVVSENGKNRTLSTAKKLVMDRHATVAGRACPLLSCP